MFSCSNLTISYNEHIIVSSLGFTLFPGAVALIRGENGSGKSSLLKVFSGIKKPDNGEIYKEQQNVAFIGHELGIIDNLSVIENIFYWSAMQGTELMVPGAVAYFHLTEIVDVPCYKLSAGMKKRVALARLLATQSNIWLLDEPENNLDSHGKELLQNLINIKASQNGIIIIASHSQLHKSSAIEINLEDFKL